MPPRIRLSPAKRREQLLDLGVRLFARRSLDELSVDVLAQEAGISRGLLYHYFGDKLGFREAVVRRAAADLIAQTAPPATGEPLERMLHSMTHYLDWVERNHEGYLSLVRGAASDETLRQVYDEARAALTDRIFASDDAGLLTDTPVVRLLVKGWAAFAEELVLTWVADPAGVDRDELRDLLAGSLLALVRATGPDVSP
jgi:AcrR family transcriptional regulator